MFPAHNKLLFTAAIFLCLTLQLCCSSPSSPRVLEEPKTLPAELNPNIVHPNYGGAGVPRFIQGTRTRRTRPSNAQHNSIRRQDQGPSSVTEGPEFELTSVSPIQASLGGLTGLQGLPPLSLIQFVKLLVAVTPFILPLIFVPLLLFTVGMFMIPVNKANTFFGGDPAEIRSNSQGTSWTPWGSSVIVPSLKKFARSVANHEDCFERIVCELGQKYFTESTGKDSVSPSGNHITRQTIIRLLNYFNHPLLKRISRSLQTHAAACSTKICNPTSFLQNFFKK